MKSIQRDKRLMRNFKKNVVEKMGSGAARAAPSKQLSQRTRAQGARFGLGVWRWSPRSSQAGGKSFGSEGWSASSLQGCKVGPATGDLVQVKALVQLKERLSCFEHKAKWATCSPQPLFRPRTVFQFIFRKMPQFINYYKLKLCWVSSLIKL